MGNAVTKFESVGLPTQVGLFVHEGRAPSYSEIAILAADIERAVAEGELGNVENNFRHSVKNGYYFRSLSLPVGAIAVGKVHRKAHFLYLESGEVSIYSTDGIKHMLPGDIHFASAMSQKVAIVGEACVLTTVEPTTKYTPEEAEEELHL